MTASEDAPILIVGAARSGTKLLRRIVAHHEGVSEVPFDVNYVWRLGHEGHPHDAFPAHAASEGASAAVRKFLARFAGEGGRYRVVEKTVSNSLRVGYVKRVLPEARLIHLIRDGYDAAASAHEQWRAPTDWMSLWPKLRTFPWWRARAYATRYAVSRARRRLRGNRAVTSWGPVYPNMADDLRRLSLLQVCAWQWRHCVQSAREQLVAVDPAHWMEIRYEELIHDPRSTIGRLEARLELDPSLGLSRVIEGIRADGVGKWRAQLDRHQWEQVAAVVEPLRSELGYPRVEADSLRPSAPPA